MHTDKTYSKRTKLGSGPADFGAPTLLLVSVAAVGVAVAAIIVVGITGAGWTVAMAFTAALLSTAAVLAFIAKMLNDAGEAGK